MRLRNKELKQEIIIMESKKKEGLEKIGRFLKMEKNLGKNLIKNN